MVILRVDNQRSEIVRRIEQETHIPFAPAAVVGKPEFRDLQRIAARSEDVAGAMN